MSATDRLLPPESPARRRFNFANVSSALALTVSVFALAVGAYQTRLMQSQARAAVWPFLTQGFSYTTDTEADRFIWQVENNGVGPAKVQSVSLHLDGEPMRNWKAVLAALGVSGSTRLFMTNVSGEVIPPSLNRETALQLIRVDARDTAALLHGAMSRFRMDICYCSVYDECWISHWQVSSVEPVARCEVPALPFEG